MRSLMSFFALALALALALPGVVRAQGVEGVARVEVSPSHASVVAGETLSVRSTFLT